MFSRGPCKYEHYQPQQENIPVPLPLVLRMHHRCVRSQFMELIKEPSLRLQYFIKKVKLLLIPISSNRHKCIVVCKPYAFSSFFKCQVRNLDACMVVHSLFNGFSSARVKGHLSRAETTKHVHASCRAKIQVLRRWRPGACHN